MALYHFTKKKPFFFISKEGDMDSVKKGKGGKCILMYSVHSSECIHYVNTMHFKKEVEESLIVSLISSTAVALANCIHKNVG